MSPLEFPRLDLSQLSEPVPRADLRFFRETALGAGIPRRDPAMPSPRAWLTAGLVAIFAIPFAVVPVILLLTDGISVMTVVSVLCGGLLVFGASLIVGRFRWPRWGSRLWRDRFLISRFAERNGARYTAAMGTPALPGLMFSRGDRRRVFDVVHFELGNWTVGNLSYRKDLPRGGAEQHLWGYVDITLPRRFPHIVLDSLSNNGVRGRELENPYKGQGAITLEGDFSRYFRLTCPPGYERDALYLLTPDLMAVLIDEGADFDIEILDNRLFLYRPRLFSLADPREWQRIQRILDTIAEGTRKRTVNYRDERVGDVRADTIAEQGSRLSTPNLGIAIVATLVVVTVVIILGAVFGGQ